jgi:hypothetical protein
MGFSCILCIFLFLIIIIIIYANYNWFFPSKFPRNVLFFSVFSTLFSFAKKTEKYFQFQCFICFSFSKKFHFSEFFSILVIPLILISTQNFVPFSSIILWNTISNPQTVFILKSNSSSYTKWCYVILYKVFNFIVV